MAENTPLKRRAAAEDDKSSSAKRMKSDYTDVLSVVVGEEGDQKTFMVYKDLINQNSKFFNAATSSSCWVEANDKTVKLPEQSPATFRIYLDALHNPGNELKLFNDAQLKCVESWSHKQSQKATFLLAKAWILGDYLGDVGFKNRAIEALLQIKECGLGRKVLGLVAEKTNPNSPLQRWMVECAYRALTSVRQERRKDLLAGVAELIARQLLLRAFQETTMQRQDMISADSLDFLEKEDEPST
ncbi:putative SKP1/BTB/POZ domain superfamily protein [Septoria linicola]|nr:putative SKP1/BTB/POZ domain superfamily protein [Septoria linicola]